MKGITICEEVWDFTGCNGYISLACGGSKGKGQKGSWQEFVFHYPDQKTDIENWFKKYNGAGYNLYWCPVIFSKPSRNKNSALGSIALYADLDEVNPESLNDIKPSIAWKSSEKRYQGLWLLSDFAGPLELESLNKRLTYFVGADKSGWDLTQMLRIPGTTNYQYNPPVSGEVLWSEMDSSFVFSSLEQELPQVESTISDQSKMSLFELITQYKDIIPKDISRLLQFPPESVTPGKRSEILWKIESTLIDAKVPMEDIYLMVQQSSWNKYRGRKDERTRLMHEINAVYRKEIEEFDKAEKVKESILSGENQPFNIIDFDYLMGQPPYKAGWLIDGFWLRGSNGIVAGEPKTFKSTITLDMAMSVASGKPLFNRYEVKERGPVVMIQNENAEWIVRDRIERMSIGKGLVGKADVIGNKLSVQWAPSLPMYFLNNQGFDFGTIEHQLALEKFLDGIKPVMIVFDPLYLMFTGDINSAQEVQPILKWLTHLKDKYHSAVIVVHHFRKGETTRSGQRMLGSTTFHGWTESSIFLKSKVLEVTNIDPVNLTLSSDPEDTLAKSEVEVDREFRSEGPRNKIYLSFDLGDNQTQDYHVEVENRPFAKLESDEPKSRSRDGNKTKELKLAKLPERDNESLISELDELFFNSNKPVIDTFTICKHLNITDYELSDLFKKCDLSSKFDLVIRGGYIKGVRDKLHGV